MQFRRRSPAPKHGRSPYLACSHALLRARCTHRHYYSYAGIEGIALHWIAEQVDIVNELGLNAQACASQRAELEAAKAKLTSLDQAIGHYLDLFESTDPSLLAPAKQRYQKMLKEHLETVQRIESLQTEVSSPVTTRADLAEALFGALSPVGKTEEEDYAHRTRFNQMLRRVVKEIRITPNEHITADFLDGQRMVLSNLADNDGFEQDMRVFADLMHDLADEGLDRWIERQPWYWSKQEGQGDANGS